MSKKILCVVLSGIMLLMSFSSVYAKDNVDEMITDGIKYAKELAGVYDGGFLAQRHILPVGNTLSDWIAMVFALNGVEDDYESYLKDLRFYVEDKYEEDGYLDRIKATEYHRIILTIYALGGDPTSFGEKPDGSSIDLLADGTYFFHGDSLGLQGLNGWIFSLISLDAKNTAVPENAKFTREDMLDAILSAQEADGGFGLSSGSSNADITAMAVQALAPYKDRSDVSEAIEKALGFMSDIMTDEGRFIAYGEESSETISQLIIALCSVGIDPMEDERFVKGGKNLLQHAESYLCKDGGFSHSYGHDDSDFMATQQMLLALTSVKLLRERECRLYDLSEYDSPEIKITDEDAGSFPTAAVVIFIAAAAIIIIGIIVKTRGKKNV
ncbi:MAG: hypothetical protein IKM61_00330 [Eubacteriaceae bacterium]|nr:hypothetical protein [Eubacteriaceae bacterium]